MLLAAGVLIRVGVYFSVFVLTDALASYPTSVVLLAGLLIVLEFTALRWVDRRTGITAFRHRLWNQKGA